MQSHLLENKQWGFGDETQTTKWPTWPEHDIQHGWCLQVGVLPDSCFFETENLPSFFWGEKEGTWHYWMMQNK